MLHLGVQMNLYAYFPRFYTDVNEIQLADQNSFRQQMHPLLNI